MKLYLAGEHTVKNGLIAKWDNLQILESYIYASQNKHFPKLILAKNFDFLLDSGAFTFMSDKKNQTGVNWDGYVERYCDFINKYKVEKFFELDIDTVVGLKEVERLRSKIERLTGRQPIPVWHKARGLDYWKCMAKDYKYIAIGGIVTREIKLNEHPIFANFNGIAKEHGAKV